MRHLVISISAAIAAAALLTITTEPRVGAPANAAQASTMSKVGVKGDRLDINRKRVCSSAQLNAAAQHNCMRPAAPTKSAPFERSVVVVLARGTRAIS
jgi:hypothetical protein